MKHNLSFEWNKAVKSKLLIILIGLISFLTLLFFGVSAFRVQSAYDEKHNELEYELVNQEERVETISQIINRIDGEDSEELIRTYEGEMEFANSLIPYAKQALEAFNSGHYLDYYVSRMEFLEQETRYEDYVDRSHVEVVGEIDENVDLMSDQARAEFALLESYKELDQPLELRESSLVYPNHLVLLIEFLLNPFVLMILVMVFNFILVEEVSEGSLQLQLLETNSRLKWFLSNKLITISLFITSILFSLLLSRVLLLLFGRPFFSVETPSWQAPFLVSNQTETIITVSHYFVWLLMTIVSLFIFLLQLFSTLLLFIKHVVTSVITFLSLCIVGYLFTLSLSSWQQWFNPFYLFMLEDQLINSPNTILIFASLGVVIGWCVILMVLSLWKINQRPI